MSMSVSSTAAPLAIMRIVVTSTLHAVPRCTTSGGCEGLPELIAQYVDVTNSTPTLDETMLPRNYPPASPRPTFFRSK
jgi:hypothetical protein